MSFKPITINQRSDLLRAVREERLRQGITGEAFDDMIGLTRAHSVKVENANKPWGKVAFTFTPTIAWILEALGLRLVLMSADEAGKLVSPEVKSFDDPYNPKTGPTPRRRPSAMVIYEWTSEPCEQP